MLLVRAYIFQSPIHGIGLFADQAIKKGDLVWKFDRLFDLIISPSEYRSLLDGPKKFMDTYSYLRKTGERVLCGDLSKFMNHSAVSPTLIQDDDEDDFAAQDILPGDELTCDYRLFDFSERSLTPC